MKFTDLHQASWLDEREALDCFAEADTFGPINIHDLSEQCCEKALLRHHDADWPDQVIAPPTSSEIFVQTAPHRGEGRASWVWLTMWCRLT
jgi:hypothetical protein